MRRVIDDHVISHIAELAKLDPDVIEREKLAIDLEKILEYTEQLNELKTENIKPLHHVSDLTNVLRNDEPHPSLQLEKTLLNAPARKGNYFLVPIDN